METVSFIIGTFTNPAAWLFPLAAVAIHVRYHFHCKRLDAAANA